MARPTRPKKPKQVENFAYDERRTNIPSAEDRSLMEEDDLTPIQVAYKRRNRDLDPQLVWRGKDEQDSPTSSCRRLRCTSRSGCIPRR